jgi:hypothetical protein
LWTLTKSLAEVGLAGNRQNGDLVNELVDRQRSTTWALIVLAEADDSSAQPHLTQLATNCATAVLFTGSHKSGKALTTTHSLQNLLKTPWFWVIPSPARVGRTNGAIPKPVMEPWRLRAKRRSLPDLSFQPRQPRPMQPPLRGFSVPSPKKTVVRSLH